MRDSVPKPRPFLISGRLILIIVTVAAATAGFLLGYFVGKSSTSSQQAPQAQPLNPGISQTALPQQTPAQSKIEAQPAPAETPSAKNETDKDAKNVVPEPKTGNSDTATAENAKDAKRDPSPATDEAPASTIYTVQAGAFKSKKEADSLRHRLETKGYKAYIKKAANSKGASVFKVRTGEFTEKKKAEMLAVKLKKTEGLDSFVTTQK